MQIVIGSKNIAKIKAVQSVFQTETIISLQVPSHVSPQPFSDKETRLGAMNRALECANLYPDSYCIGLEGGVMYVEKDLFLCNWGAFITPNKQIFTASGARIKLPDYIKADLISGKELGEVMGQFTKNEDVRHKEGAIGVFTNNEITRESMFAHVIHLLKGQWLYYKEKAVD